MQIKLTPGLTKKEVFTEIENYLQYHGFKTISKDETRPWGGFFVIDENQSQKFVDFFFADVPLSDKSAKGKISPKILIVEKGKRLSWQYHFRRAELWKVIGGEAGVITSDNDEEKHLQKKNPGDIILLKQGERHRLVGLEDWGIIAEIWKHTDEANPSNEEDIVRLQDDFGR